MNNSKGQLSQPQEEALGSHIYFRSCPPCWVLDQKQSALFSLSHIGNCPLCLQYWAGKSRDKRRSRDSYIENLKNEAREGMKKFNKVVPGQLWYLDQNLEGWDLERRGKMRFFRSPIVLILDVQHKWAETSLVCNFSELASTSCGDILLKNFSAFAESWNVFMVPIDRLQVAFKKLEEDNIVRDVRLKQGEDKSPSQFDQNLFRFRNLELDVTYFFSKKVET